MQRKAGFAQTHRTAAFTVALLAAFAASMSAAAQKPVDFTGTWTLDLARSEGVPEGVMQAMTVRHAGDRIEIETTVTTPAGEQRIKDVYVLDGKQTEYVAPVVGAGSGKGQRTSRRLPGSDGFEATEAATLSGPDGNLDVDVSRRWTLAPDGKTLTIEMITTGLDGKQQSRRVFVRK
jgi:hypothetical protein